MSELFTEDSWMSATIGVKSYRYDLRINSPQPNLIESMRDLALGQDAFFFTKIPVDQPQEVSRLTQQGFILVDTNIILERRPAQICLELPVDVKVVEARPEHHSALQRIAGSCFRYSRFHQDALFPSAVANRVKQKWIENCCVGKRGVMLYAALLEGVPVGFLAVLTTSGHSASAVIDLIGVDSKYQRRGVGRALVARFIENWQSRFERLMVGTQVTNRSSLALYENAGFKVAYSAYVLHAHARAGTMIQ